MKINPWPTHFSGYILSNPYGRFLTLEAQKSWININVKKLRNIAQIVKKNFQIRDVNFLQGIQLHLKIV